MRRFVYVLIFLALVGEQPGIYEDKWSTPMSLVGTVLLEPSPVKLPLFDLIVLTVLAMNWSRISPKTCARPMVRFIWIALAALAGTWVWGVARGGNLQQTLWQLHGLVMMFFVALMLMATLKTPRDFYGLGKVIVAGALYRSLMVCVFYFGVVQVLNMYPVPMTMTTHSDTTLFVTGIVLVVSYAAEKRTRRSMLFALGCSFFIALAIQLNNRRLAWASLFASLLVVYGMLPKARIKKINRVILMLIPVIVAYVAIGWGRTEGIFKPVGSLSTMFGTTEDVSSQTRNIENYNLIQTLNGNPAIGTGWGHEYNEVSIAYSIKEAFPQYRYIPHNSLLGLLAFTGLIGFTATWLVLPVSAFLNARTYRESRSVIERVAAVTAISEVIVYANQAYGDMGLGFMPCTLLIASAFAVAARLSISSGAWPGAGTKAKTPTDTPNLVPVGVVPEENLSKS